MKNVFAADVSSSTSLCWGPTCEKNQDPLSSVGTLFGSSIKIFLIVGALIAFVYLLWAGVDWITSEGDKDKLAKARNKMTHALIGLIILFGVTALWQLIAGDILGIIKTNSSGGFSIKIPSLIGN